MGEAPPPLRFFFFGDSLFFRYLRQAFAPLAPEVEKHDAGWFLAFFGALGGWRMDVCDAPGRATKGGADDVGDCLERFEERWHHLSRDDDALVIVSPKRLLACLPPAIRAEVSAAVPPPGQWNAHRLAFLRETTALIERYVGRDELRQVARSIAVDEAALDFEIARASAEGASEDELRCLLRGHPRETTLVAAWERGTEE